MSSGVSELVMDVEKQGSFFEKIAKLHETMEKMNDHDFGQALKVVKTLSITLNIGQ